MRTLSRIMVRKRISHPTTKERSKGRTQSTFRGKTPEMQGKIFQVHGEPKRRGEFKSAMETFEIYAGEFYLHDITLLQPMFKELKNNRIDPPSKPPDRISSKTGVKAAEDIISE